MALVAADDRHRCLVADLCLWRSELLMGRAVPYGVGAGRMRPPAEHGGDTGANMGSRSVTTIQQLYLR